MTDEHRDLDAVLDAASRGVRPGAEFEESLLLRLDEVLEERPDHAPVVLDLEPAPRAARARSPRRFPALARAAVVVAILGAIGAGIVLSRDEGGPNVTSELPASVVELLADSCETNLITTRPHEGVAGRDGQVQLDDATDALVDLRLVIDDYAVALNRSRDLLAAEPGTELARDRLDQAAATLAAIDELMVEEEVIADTGSLDGARYSMPLVVADLDVLASDLAALGIPECDPSRD